MNFGPNAGVTSAPATAPDSLALFNAALEAPEPARLLLVDDDVRMRLTMGELLALPDREIADCGSGADALALLTVRPFDLVLLDIRMPDMTGLEVLAALREAGLRTTVIIVSGDDAVDSAIAALKHGAHEYVRKPFEPASLRRTVDNALAQIRLGRENERMRERLEQSERLHRYLVDQSPDLIYTLDPSGRFTFVNDRFAHLLGFVRTELLGVHYSAIVHGDDLPRADHCFNERRTGSRAVSNIEFRLRPKPQPYANGTPRTVVVSAMGVYTNGADPGHAPGQFLGTYGVCRDISDRKRAEEIISYHAFHDQITGLPNRTLFRDRLSQAIAQSRRKNSQLAVLFLDLDRFKLVNDTHGHVQGDLLLQQVAVRLRRCLRGSDTLSRLGGDEFTILVPDLHGPADAEAKAQRILEELRRPFRVEDEELTVSASIGVAIYPGHGATEDELVRNADLAMYQVKRRGKDGAAFFAPEMSGLFSEKIRLESELRRALQRGEFELHYQPIHNVVRGTVEAVEALARWRHPRLGLLDPARFIYIAEETGLVCTLGDIVLDAGCAQLKAWQRQGMPALRLAVNISARDFEREDFVRRVAGALGRNDIPAAQLELEITESVLIEDADSAAEKVRQLRKHGVRVSIDDFGTRYSSLGYLQRFPVNTIKIDQLFTRELEGSRPHSPIVAAIVGIARGFGLDLVAEGVERESHRELLRGLGCENMQGYLFTRPLPPDELVGYLREVLGRDATPRH
jgi:diguanylate cyclase (GGDEF)-like protein/PAS domain S-box-containing protein